MTDRRFTIMSYALFVVPMLVTLLLGCSVREPTEYERAREMDMHILEVGPHGMVYHDDRRGVTCYGRGTGFSCVADSALSDGGAR